MLHATHFLLNCFLFVSVLNMLMLILVLPLVASLEVPVVQIKQGSLEGTIQTTLGGREIAAFLGVPYADPPRRFQVASPPSKWEGTLNATEVRSDCLQYSEQDFQVHGSEDCLYANIYVPEEFRRSNRLYNVIIYIHGGGFSFMYGHYGPRYLLDHDVILVTFTYRVGPLGFLSTGDRVIPGNNGLKDQSMLLKWVSQNIRAFSGNPDKITIAGTSAGGVSVHYHMLSPLSRGLFHHAFSMSGTTLLCWPQTENAREKATKLAENLGCATSSSEEILQCLASKNATDIVWQMKTFQKWIYYPFTVFGPVVEPESPNAFISKFPSEIIRDGEAQDVPWLTTVTSEEGLFPVADFIANETLLNHLNENWNEILPSLLDYENTISIVPRDVVSQRIRDAYIGNKNLKNNLPGLIQMCSDRLFVGGVCKAAKLHAQHYKSPVYSYLFSYRGAHSCSETVSKSTTNYGVAHGDDTGYIFQNELINVEDSDQDKKMIEIMTKLTVSFANKGKPELQGVDWPEVDSTSEFTFVHIKGPETFEIERNSTLGNPNFWSSLKLSED